MIIYYTVHSAVIVNSIEVVNTAPSSLLSLGKFLFLHIWPAADIIYLAYCQTEIWSHIWLQKCVIKKKKQENERAIEKETFCFMHNFSSCFVAWLTAVEGR